MIKLAIISIVLLFAVATGISLLIPSHVRISKAINIHGSKDSLLSLVGDMERWKEWHPAFLPSDTPRKFERIRMIQRTVTDSSVSMQLQQGNKQPVTTGWNVYTYSTVDSIAVQWYMDFDLKWYPWQKFGSLFYENAYGVMMEQGLTNLKKKVQR